MAPVSSPERRQGQWPPVLPGGGHRGESCPPSQPHSSCPGNVHEKPGAWEVQPWAGEHTPCPQTGPGAQVLTLPMTPGASCLRQVRMVLRVTLTRRWGDRNCERMCWINRVQKLQERSEPTYAVPPSWGSPPEASCEGPGRL
jgi:hypothetical protein